MGIVSSTDTRRISFDNKFAISPTLSVQNSIEDNNINDVLQIEDITADDENDLLFLKDNKQSDPQEGDPDYWLQRLDTLRKEHLMINKIVETEFEKTAENARKFYDIPNITPEKIQKMKPCFDWRTKIMQCYEDNPRQPLVCSGVVQAFSNCVASCRTAKE